MSYSLTSYITTYLKTHYPVEYMAAILSTISDDKDRVGIYVNECRRLGIKVSPPSINKSDEEFTVVSNNEILFGLRGIGGLGAAACQDIFSSRTSEYRNLYDFLRRVHTNVLNKATLEALIESGALDELVEEQPTRTLKKTEILDLEKSRLGTYISDHPVMSAWVHIESEITHTIAELENLKDREQVVLGGMVTKVTKKITKKGDKMYLLLLEDISGPVEVICFSYQNRYESYYQEGNFLIVRGTIRKEGDEGEVSKFILNELKALEINQYQLGRPIHLTMHHYPRPGIIKDINELIEETPGDSLVFLHIIQDSQEIILQMKKPTSVDIEKDLKDLIYNEPN